MKIYITRHGETNYNKDKRVCGLLNGILTEKGLKQADDLASHIFENKDFYNIKKIYVSSLERAKITAKPIENKLNLIAIEDDRLKEFDFGLKDGCPVKDQEFYNLRRQPFYKFPKGESTLSAAHRIYSCLDDIIKNNNENILIVCHGTVAKIIKTYFENLTEEEYYNFLMDNCSLLTFQIDK